MTATVADVGSLHPSALTQETKHRVIPHERVTAALQLVDDSGVVEEIGRWRAEDRAGRHAGGRPAAMGDRAILTLFVLLTFEHSPQFVDRAAEAVASRLTPESLRELGIVRHPADGSDDDWYDRCWRALHRLLDVIDPYPAPRNRLVTTAEYDAIVAGRDPATQTERKRRLDRVVTRLIDATWRLLPREVRRRWKGNVAVDATPVVAFAKPSTARAPFTAEPDAAWYIREGDHRDRGDQNGKKPRKSLFGWEVHIVIATANDPDRAPDFPLLATGIAFDRPGHNIAEHTAAILTSMTEREMPVGLAAGDRAYWSNSQPEKLQLRARALGWANVNDYRVDELGTQAGHGGGIMVEGAWYCPSMPTPLVEASIDYRVHKTIDEPTWRRRIDDRTRYRLMPKERPDANGHQPLRCPAIGKSATVACPLRTASMTGTGVHLRSRVQTPPEHPDRVCTQTSVSFPPSAGAKYRQDLQYGTPAWQAAYATARNTIEGFNGYLKDGAREALSDPTRRRIRGRTAQHLLTSLLVMSANVRKIRTYLTESAADPGRVARLSAKRSRRKRRESLTDYLPDANAPPEPTGTE